jgi:hypothetical protein
VQRGDWRHCDPIPVDIPATLGYDRRVWYAVRKGMRGILVPDERGAASVYMIFEPASHYYRTRTGGRRMPVQIVERIYAREKPSNRKPDQVPRDQLTIL